MEENNETLETIKKLSSEIDKLKKNQKKQERRLKSQQIYLNNLYLDYDLKPKGVIKYLQNLSQELLNFVAKICEKYEITWWMDFGNLLGATRHKNFVPWDDDIDIAMTRKDFIKFSEVIEKEIKSNGLDNILRVSTKRVINSERVVAFTQIMLYNNGLYSGLDIFPKDFINNPPHNFKELYTIERNKFHDNVFNGTEKNEAIKEVYENLNLSMEKQKFLVSGIETPNFPSTFIVIETDSVFPLKEMEFNGLTYPCPNNVDSYLTQLYGEYKEIPKFIVRHERSYKLKQKKNVEKNFETFIKLLKEANENFLY